MTWKKAIDLALYMARLTGTRHEVRGKFWPWVGTPNGWAYYVRPAAGWRRYHP